MFGQVLQKYPKETFHGYESVPAVQSRASK